MKAIWRATEEMRERIWKVRGYIPTPAQREAHLSPERIKLVLGGERAGKSRLTGEEALIWLFGAEKGDVTTTSPIPRWSIFTTRLLLWIWWGKSPFRSKVNGGS